MGFVATHENVLPEPLVARLFDVLRQLSRGFINQIQGTLWFPAGERPRNLVELAISQLRGTADPEGVCAGAEWWVRVRHLDEDMPLHFDRDLGLHRETGQTVHPHLASILYLNGTDRPTTILNHVLAGDARTIVADSNSQGELVFPKRNRFVLFPGNFLHGVLSVGEPVPPDDTDGKNPRRVTVLINWWKSRPHPAGCHDYSSRHPLAGILALPAG